jgi:hypothetical protein
MVFALENISCIAKFVLNYKKNPATVPEPAFSEPAPEHAFLTSGCSVPQIAAMEVWSYGSGLDEYYLVRVKSIHGQYSVVLSDDTSNISVIPATKEHSLPTLNPNAKVIIADDINAAPSNEQFVQEDPVQSRFFPETLLNTKLPINTTILSKYVFVIDKNLYIHYNRNWYKLSCKNILFNRNYVLYTTIKN